MKASRDATVEKRLKKLRERFAADVHVKSIDKDFTGVTSGNLEFIEVRIEQQRP